MHARVCAKADVASKIETMPPWPHEEKRASLDHSTNPFRQEHVAPGCFAVMYSGNHSPANPISTVLQAAEGMKNEQRLVFFSIGGGSGKREVEQMIASGAKNLRSLPYQPLDRIRYSLSAADVHVVSIGDDVVGIVHPCKVYGAMAVARPILLLGPQNSHVGDLIAEYRIGWHVKHGDVEQAKRVLAELLKLPENELRAMGARAAAAVAGSLSKNTLLRRFCDVLQRGLPAGGTGVA
jgi:glycosyltransferase involved in cell wall biosynthesis